MTAYTQSVLLQVKPNAPNVTIETFGVGHSINVYTG